MISNVPDAWCSWSPIATPHVAGRYTRRVWDPESKTFEPQQVEAKCTICNQEWRTTCESGRVRERIAKFASLHLHEEMKRRTKTA